jgi:hypothetical protein
MERPTWLSAIAEVEPYWGDYNDVLDEASVNWWDDY